MAFLLMAVMPAMEPPADVERVTVDNPHEWPAGVEVAGGERDGWVGLGAVERQASETFEDVLDQGGQWAFRFSYAGVAGGEVALPRADLDRRGWKITVPDTFAERMRAAGLAPSGG